MTAAPPLPHDSVFIQLTDVVVDTGDPLLARICDKIGCWEFYWDKSVMLAGLPRTIDMVGRTAGVHPERLN